MLTINDIIVNCIMIMNKIEFYYYFKYKSYIPYYNKV